MTIHDLGEKAKTIGAILGVVMVIVAALLGMQAQASSAAASGDAKLDIKIQAVRDSEGDHYKAMREDLREIRADVKELIRLQSRGP